MAPGRGPRSKLHGFDSGIRVPGVHAALEFNGADALALVDVHDVDLGGELQGDLVSVTLPRRVLEAHQQQALPGLVLLAQPIEPFLGDRAVAVHTAQDVAFPDVFVAQQRLERLPVEVKLARHRFRAHVD
jgi:hypothetical protein